MNKVIVEESAKEKEEPAGTEAKESSSEEQGEKSGIGNISFVSCATGSESLEPSSLESEKEEEGGFVSVCWLLAFDNCFHCSDLVLFSVLFLSEAKPRLTKETNGVTWWCDASLGQGEVLRFT